MRHALIVADLGHASPRIPGICRYLYRFGWQHTIITPQMTMEQKDRFLVDGGQSLSLVETNGFPMLYRTGIKPPLPKMIHRWLIQKGLKLILRERYEYPDSHTRWEPHVLKAVSKLLKKRKIDIIFSSSSPVSCHIISKRICLASGIPWIADMRDLWTQNHAYPYSPKRRAMERVLELETMDSVHALITVTPQLQAKLIKLHGKATHFIPNGFYPPKKVPPEPKGKTLSLVYTGQIYPAYQNVNLIIDAVKELYTTREIAPGDVTLHFYGQSSGYVGSISKKAHKPLPEFIKLGGWVSRKKTYEIQQMAHALLLLNWEDIGEKGVAQTKLYEYLAAKRPIIATGGFGSDYVEALLEKTGSGLYCLSLESIKKQLLIWLRELKSSDCIKLCSKNSAIEEYSYPNAAKLLSIVFDKALNNSRQKSRQEAVRT
jgi:glycosyltransferase involved in cell wall biosynthesis